ncbi:LOW QUALITY PROTEIN: hypothetical protein BRADI_3g06724v3 [Brachypodium distachyon]|uniref:BTB domain-containing protein n=1 Tax=Brachypodium distachyon TaxID=15368 RepID=A0A2K2CVL4_BRADI|nr:LOW QUALITY PROTEIN: hypothetical protein BRADI_3g06724v3 [Brachypodium distachyon]
MAPTTAAALAVAVPPSNIGEHLLRLLENEEGADVTFQVGRRDSPRAHALVLSARSPVLRATLSDEQKKKNPVLRRMVVLVEGIGEAAFEALLHFAYADALPAKTTAELLGSGSETTVRARMEAAGELIAAAERYGMERMQLLCERALCEAVADAETAAATLVLADRIECQQLKAFCVEFIAAEPGVLRGMMGTDAYMLLKESCPVVLVDIMEKVVAALDAQAQGNCKGSSPAPSKRRKSMYDLPLIAR